MSIMDSLIYYSNSYLETVNDELNLGMTMLPPNQLLLDESFSNIQDTSFSEPLYDSNSKLFLPGVNTYHELNNFQSCPKRQKFFQDNCYQPPDHEITNYFNGFVANPTVLQDLSSFSLPSLPANYKSENALEGKVSSVKKCNNEKNLSAQSIAARQRRKKITDKTEELGKLIPGGQKMNTADMFQAAYKYINFLQAQLGILQFMASYHQEKGEPFQTPQLHKFVGSPLIQEKLYYSDKCLVPEMFLEALANDHEFQHSNPRVLKEVNQLIKPGCQAANMDTTS